MAWLRQETGAAQGDAALRGEAWISAVNFAEVLSKVGERGGDVRAAARDRRIEGLLVGPHGEEAALTPAELRLTRARGTGPVSRLPGVPAPPSSPPTLPGLPSTSACRCRASAKGAAPT